MTDRRRRTAGDPALITLDGPPRPVVPAGIARRAAAAPEIDARNEVSYALLPCRSLISRCDSARVPFRWTINPYRGCEFGCVYCYARYTHEYLELERWIDFERKIFVKEGAADLLVEELRRSRREGEWIVIGTATDPYQPAERRHQVTRSLLEVFARYRDLRLSITTKSDLVLRDLELLQSIHQRSELQLNMSVTTLRRDLARILEPRAVRPDRRLRAVDLLRQAGISVNVFLAPVMPGINDAAPDLEQLVAEIAAACSTGFMYQVLFLPGASARRFYPFLREHFPALLARYQRLYGPGNPGLDPYKQGIRELMASLRTRYGLDRIPETETQGRTPAQGALPL
jgi:DNA repair photolyase